MKSFNELQWDSSLVSSNNRSKHLQPTHQIGGTIFQVSDEQCWKNMLLTRPPKESTKFDEPLSQFLFFLSFVKRNLLYPRGFREENGCFLNRTLPMCMRVTALHSTCNLSLSSNMEIEHHSSNMEIEQLTKINTSNLFLITKVIFGEKIRKSGFEIKTVTKLPAFPCQ